MLHVLHMILSAPLPLAFWSLLEILVMSEIRPKHKTAGLFLNAILATRKIDFS